MERSVIGGLPRWSAAKSVACPDEAQRNRWPAPMLQSGIGVTKSTTGKFRVNPRELNQRTSAGTVFITHANVNPNKPPADPRRLNTPLIFADSEILYSEFIEIHLRVSVVINVLTI